MSDLEQDSASHIQIEKHVLEYLRQQNGNDGWLELFNLSKLRRKQALQSCEFDPQNEEPSVQKAIEVLAQLQDPTNS